MSCGIGSEPNLRRDENAQFVNPKPKTDSWHMPTIETHISAKTIRISVQAAQVDEGPYVKPLIVTRVSYTDPYSNPCNPK